MWVPGRRSAALFYRIGRAMIVTALQLSRQQLKRSAERRPGFAAYAERTSMIVPMPPKADAT